MFLQPLDHQFLGGPVGLRDQIELTLQLKADVALKIPVQQGPGLPGDFLADL
jgi:hypothetical protein